MLLMLGDRCDEAVQQQADFGDRSSDDFYVRDGIRAQMRRGKIRVGYFSEQDHTRGGGGRGGERDSEEVEKPGGEFNFGLRVADAEAELQVIHENLWRSA